jgi:hypothetical protein
VARIPAVGLAVALVASACGGDGVAPSPATTPPTSPPVRNPAAAVEGEPYAPAIDPADFVATIDNPYLPLTPGTVLIYEGVSEGEREVDVVRVTHLTKEILGVTATVVRDEVFVGGELAELTFDWYAQDVHGNVWYLGEDSKEYENGEVVSTAGSWEAGVDGAQPGILMLGAPQIGDLYRQEYYAGEAEDMARVVALDGAVTVPYGAFDAVLVTEDSTPLEPKLLERKYYAPGIGVVLERLIEGGHEVLRLVEVRR